MTHNVTSTLVEGERFYTPEEAVAVAHQLGLINVTEKTLKTAAYYGERPLKRSKIGGRVYFAQSDIEAWISGCKVQD
ncbi:helix-turn-helix domain-containing protein [Mycobacterium sp. DL440]|uniref:helix-turn-helix domain-containing protein n=1 Tax=Mycobacterium sp. DL440 TaxID=2675523 RepID=UPI0014220BB2|nr:helix-turn-helix domain-containing protein [Mycobacterium sp. DL440]